MSNAIVGIIGGSGLYNIDGLKVTGEKEVNTPFGKPSDSIVLGNLDGHDVAFLPRHGRGHRILPHEINFRANIYAMKSLGVERIISVSAVGSMKEAIRPGDIVIVDQFVDRTKLRPDTFFGNGIAVHVSFADPVCPLLCRAILDSAQGAGTVHKTGTYVCIEGPMFSSRAESNIYRSWNADVIGMTNYQEAKLAREAEICYATIALATDYDCWRKEEGPVDVAMVIKTLSENVEKAKAIIRKVLPQITVLGDCSCQHALENAIITDRKAVSDDVKNRLKIMIGRYV